MIALLLMEGYKLSDGNIMDLTRPQIMFLNEFVKFKVRAKRGKGMQRGGPRAGYTPEKLAEKMQAKFKKTDEHARNAEQAAAKEAREAWDARWRQPRQKDTKYQYQRKK